MAPRPPEARERPVSLRGCRPRRPAGAAGGASGPDPPGDSCGALVILQLSIARLPIRSSWHGRTHRTLRQGGASFSRPRGRAVVRQQSLYVNKVIVFMAASWAVRGSERRAGASSGLTAPGRSDAASGPGPGLGPGLGLVLRLGPGLGLGLGLGLGPGPGLVLRLGLGLGPGPGLGLGPGPGLGRAGAEGG